MPPKKGGSGQKEKGKGKRTGKGGKGEKGTGKGKSGKEKKSKKRKVMDTFEEDMLKFDELTQNDHEEDGEEKSNKNQDSLFIEEEDTETVDERRLRLAKEKLKRIGADRASDDEEEDHKGITGDRVGDLLYKDVLRARGKLQKLAADKFVARLMQEGVPRFLKGHRLAVTCCAISADQTVAYTGSKDCCVIRWDLPTGNRLVFKGKKAKGENPLTSKGHTDQVLAVAVTWDNKLVASAGKDKTIRIWDAATGNQIHVFSGHSNIVNCLAFRNQTYQLFSGSNDRTVKVWNCEEMGYIETLYGHNSAVFGLDSLNEDRALSCGYDKTIRLWKVVEETQLLFKDGHTSSIDTVTMVNEEIFFSGSQDGSVALWSSRKKKPSAQVYDAHDGKWITAVAAYKYSDLVVSGSSNGEIRFWKIQDGRLTELKDIRISVQGFVNSLAWSQSGKVLVAAIGQEPRLGRWERMKGVKNGILVINLSGSDDLS